MEWLGSIESLSLLNMNLWNRSFHALFLKLMLFLVFRHKERQLQILANVEWKKQDLEKESKVLEHWVVHGPALWQLKSPKMMTEHGREERPWWQGDRG